MTLTLIPTYEAIAPYALPVAVICYAGYRVYKWIKEDREKSAELKRAKEAQHKSDIDAAASGARLVATDWENLARARQETIEEQERELQAKQRTIMRLLDEKESWIEERGILESKISEKSLEILDVKAHVEGMERRLQEVEGRR